jgi:hypothetical protein
MTVSLSSAHLCIRHSSSNQEINSWCGTLVSNEVQKTAKPLWRSSSVIVAVNLEFRYLCAIHVNVSTEEDSI